MGSDGAANFKPRHYRSPHPGARTGCAKLSCANMVTVNRALSRAKAIPADIRDQIKGTKLDTGTYLDSLKGMDPDDQRPSEGHLRSAPPYPMKTRCRTLGASVGSGDVRNFRTSLELADFAS